MALTPDAIGLPGKVALVTGAARGIGRATALLLAQAGAELALCDREGDELEATAALVRAAGPQVDPVRAVLDVRDAAAVEAFVGQVGDRHGRVDVLVNNAGGTFAAVFLDVSVRAEAALIAENFTQVTGFVRTVAPLMPAGGSIVNLTSVEAHQAAPGFAVYAAMKAGLAHLTTSLALELGTRGIRVNAVAPDAVGGAGDDALRDAFLQSGIPYEPAHLPPLGHFGEPVDAAAAILFLAGDLARFVTGTTVHVDGGTHAAGGWHRTLPTPST
ncbi:MAG TPA: SDR family oxidoreductase [Acidimicrobiales bacterium]|nr:SDR family oxidoreductase [Acidimicrobiales bacterium]